MVEVIARLRVGQIDNDSELEIHFLEVTFCPRATLIHISRLTFNLNNYDNLYTSMI